MASFIYADLQKKTLKRMTKICSINLKKGRSNNTSFFLRKQKYFVVDHGKQSREELYSIVNECLVNQ